MDVTLVSMPFAEVQRPSIALGLLRATLKGSPITSEVVYGNIKFAESVGIVAYQAMQSTPTDHLLGEWCFAEGLFPECWERDEEYLDLVLNVRCYGFPAELEQRKDLMRWVRAQSTSYIDYLAADIVTREPRVVGCSSVFQQHCASLALLKRIRELSPETVTLMGGANCEDEMGIETLKMFPWVDCVVSGEGDHIFPELCHLLLDQGRKIVSTDLPYGAICQSQQQQYEKCSQHTGPTPRPVIKNLDSLPIPDYDSYFAALLSSTLSGMVKPGLLAESSRGCWWGERSHCTFCGLNGTGMGFRSKSPKRILNELSELTRRYEIRNIQFVDNILDMSYLKTVLPLLANLDEPYSLFYETKANLKRDHVQLLAEAGVRWIQPGIESLNDDLLCLIGKGNSSTMNLQLLKWAIEYDIDASWNMLSDIPGGSDIWYKEMAEWLPAIFHLQPPTGLIRIRYDRFSPYHKTPQAYGLTLAPSRAYQYVYPFPLDTLMRLAYSFENHNHGEHIHRSVQHQPGQQKLQAVIEEWNAIWISSRPVLQVHDEGTQLQFIDTRPCTSDTFWIAGEIEAALYRLCDTAQTTQALLKQLSIQEGSEVTLNDIQPAIDTLCRARVLLPISGKLLGIGINQQQVKTQSTSSTRSSDAQTVYNLQTQPLVTIEPVAT